jgi:hypothetical protein
MALSVLTGSESMVAKKVAIYEGPGFSFFVMTSGLRSLRDKALLYFEEAYTRQIAARDRLFKVVNLDAGQVRTRGGKGTPAAKLSGGRPEIVRLRALLVSGLSGRQLGSKSGPTRRIRSSAIPASVSRSWNVP